MARLRCPFVDKGRRVPGGDLLASGRGGIPGVLAWSWHGKLCPHCPAHGRALRALTRSHVEEQVLVRLLRLSRRLVLELS